MLSLDMLSFKMLDHVIHGSSSEYFLIQNARSARWFGSFDFRNILFFSLLFVSVGCIRWFFLVGGCGCVWWVCRKTSENFVLDHETRVITLHCTTDAHPLYSSKVILQAVAEEPSASCFAYDCGSSPLATHMSTSGCIGTRSLSSSNPNNLPTFTK